MPIIPESYFPIISISRNEENQEHWSGPDELISCTTNQALSSCIPDDLSQKLSELRLALSKLTSPGQPVKHYENEHWAGPDDLLTR